MTESNDTQRRKFNLRGFASLIVTITFGILVLTGIFLYVTPQGRVANWTDWRLLGLTKDQWAAVHTTMSILFIIASAIHIYYNWKTIVGYLVRRRKFNLKLETSVAVLLIAGVFLGTYYEVPPFSNIIEYNASIKEYWDTQSQQAPYPHAEASTVEAFAAQTGAKVEEVIEKLRKAGIEVSDPKSQTIGELAESIGLAPSELFAKISSTASNTATSHTTGLGMQTLTVFCATNNVDLQNVLNLLSREGFQADGNATMKSVAGQKGLTPTELKDLILEKAK